MHIDHYSFGKININGSLYQGDLILAKEKVYLWPCLDHHHPTMDDFSEALKDEFDVIIIATGYSGVMDVPEQVRKKLSLQTGELMITDTRKATTLFNQYSAQNKKILAYFHLDC